MTGEAGRRLPEQGTTDPRSAVAAAGRAELCWTGPSGPDASVETPLWHDGALWTALPYSRRAQALAAADAREVALVLHPARADDATPRLVRGAVRLVEDPLGERFVADLVGQHLAKHPPSRALADSVILRREHWWYVPRLLLRVEVSACSLLPAPGWLLLARRTDDAPAVSVVRAGAAPPRAGTDAVDGPALLHAARASEDQERTVEQRVPGRLHGGSFLADGADEGPGRAPGDAPPEPSLPPTPGLLARWRHQRALEAACLAGLHDAGLA